jgi:hypothetical protein
MKPNPSWEASISSVSEEIPQILRKQKIHYRIHKSPLPVPMLSQINPVHAFQPYICKTNFNIILPSMLRSSKWSLFLRFPHHNPVCISPHPYTFHMPHPFYSSWFDVLHNSNKARNISNNSFRTCKAKVHSSCLVFLRTRRKPFAWKREINRVNNIDSKWYK